MNNIKRERPSEKKSVLVQREKVLAPSLIPLNEKDILKDNGLTQGESDDLSFAIANLKPLQIKAAMLESSGTSRTLISEQLGIAVVTLNVWNQNEYYKKIIMINSTVLERQGRDFRIKQVKQIIAPAYVELIKRMRDPAKLAVMETKDIVDLITKMSREIRSELVITTKEDAEEGSELADLQRRRTHLAALKNQAIESLEHDSNIIQFPKIKAA